MPRLNQPWARVNLPWELKKKLVEVLAREPSIGVDEEGRKGKRLGQYIAQHADEFEQFNEELMLPDWDHIVKGLKEEVVAMPSEYISEFTPAAQTWIRSRKLDLKDISQVEKEEPETKEVRDLSVLAQHQKEHFDDIHRLISEWRAQIKVPEAGYALSEEVIFRGYFGPVGIHEERHILDEGVVDLLKLGLSVDDPLVTDGLITFDWKVDENGLTELYCPVEDELLFTKSVPPHLPGLWDKFKQWKKKGGEYLRRCFNLYESISKEIEEKVKLPRLLRGSDESEYGSGIIIPDFPDVIYKDAIWSTKGYVYGVDKDTGIRLFKGSHIGEARPPLPFSIFPSHSGLCELRLAKMVVARGSAVQMVECKNIYESMMLRYRGNEQVASLIDFEAELKKLTEELDRELEAASLMKIFPGKCELCPIINSS